MTYEIQDRKGEIRFFEMSDELTPKEAMERLGVFDRPYQVRRHPRGRPDLVSTVQQWWPGK